MKQLFVIYGEPTTGKTELITTLDELEGINTLTYDFSKSISINKEKGVVVIDNFYDEKDVNKIIELFNKGEKYFNKENHMFEYYNIRKIILVGNRNLNEDEVIKIKNEVNDEVLISTFEAKRL